MKYKTTAKALKEGYYKILDVGYCDLQFLLKYQNPVAYSSGVYGWNFDVYDINGVAIATGYRGMPSKNTKNITYKIMKEYDDKAQGKTAAEIEVLLKEFMALV